MPLKVERRVVQVAFNSVKAGSSSQLISRADTALRKSSLRKLHHVVDSESKAAWTHRIARNCKLRRTSLLYTAPEEPRHATRSRRAEDGSSGEVAPARGRDPEIRRGEKGKKTCICT